MTERDLSFEIRQIEAGDRLTGLSLGSEFTALKTYLQRHAKAHHDRSLARTYGVFEVMPGRDDGAASYKIVGYVTLVCGEVVIGTDDPLPIGDEQVSYAYRHYPAVKIARLAVDQRYRGMDIGSNLVQLALGIAKETICPAVGCRFVVVDSKKSAVSFYLKAGFSLLDTTTNRSRDEPVMFVDLQKV